jgi:hypothetical protein
MSISEETVRITYLCDGATQEYTIPFTFSSNDEVKVERWDNVTWLTEELYYPTDYVVTDVVTTTLLYDSGDKITVYRGTPQNQETALEEKGQISSSVLESTFDKATRQSQEQEDALGRTIRVPVSDGSISQLPSKSRRANATFAFDGNGDPLMSAGTSGEVDISTAMVDFVQSASLPAARTELDVYSKSEVDSEISTANSDLAGVGRTTETIKDNADDIATNASDIATLEGKVVPTGGTEGQALVNAYDTDSDDVAITLPSSPTLGDLFEVWNTGTNGNHVTGLPDSIELGDGKGIRLRYVDGWKYEDVIIDEYEDTGTTNMTANYTKWAGGRMTIRLYQDNATSNQTYTFLETFNATPVSTTAPEFTGDGRTAQIDRLTTTLIETECRNDAGNTSTIPRFSIIEGRWKA